MNECSDTHNETQISIKIDDPSYKMSLEENKFDEMIT